MCIRQLMKSLVEKTTPPYVIQNMNNLGIVQILSENVGRANKQVESSEGETELWLPKRGENLLQKVKQNLGYPSGVKTK